MRKTVFLATVMLLSVAMIWSSCKKDESSGGYNPTGVTISGVVKNVSDIGVKNATVVFTSSAKTVTGNTDAEGNYQLTDIPEGSYSVTVDATGYNQTSESDISVTSGEVYNFSIFGSANVSGKVLNSQTGQGLEGVEVLFTLVNNKSTNSVNSSDFRIYSNSQGIYQINQVPTGTFNISFNSPGFFANDIMGVNLSSGDNNLGEYTVVEEVAEGQVRIVLTWGENPTDLDTHITGPTSSGNRFHIYYENQVVSDGTEANLDVDDTQSYGPETITINTYMDGVYRYSVHNYTDQSTEGGIGIFESPAKVEIFDSNGIIATFTPAFVTGSANTWRVFEFSISNDVVSITSLDEYVYVEDYSNGDSFKYGGTKTAKFNTKDF